APRGRWPIRALTRDWASSTRRPYVLGALIEALSSAVLYWSWVARFLEEALSERHPSPISPSPARHMLRPPRCLSSIPLRSAGDSCPPRKFDEYARLASAWPPRRSG